MNPNGLFVTTDFYTAKDFGYHYDDQVILEFTADSDDLDTPVWNGQDSYFGQGTNPQPFHNRSERITQKLHYQDNAENSEFPFVSQSDNPAMADRIFNNNEFQALFYGDLNPNQIKRFWWKKKDTNEYIPLTFKQFMKKFSSYSYQHADYGRTSIEKEKIYSPTEDWHGPEDFAEHVRISNTARGWTWDKEIEQNCIDIARNWENAAFNGGNLSMSDIEMMHQMLFPKQIIGILGVDGYRDNFDRYYPEFRTPGNRV